MCGNGGVQDLGTVLGVSAEEETAFSRASALDTPCLGFLSASSASSTASASRARQEKYIGNAVTQTALLQEVPV